MVPLKVRFDFNSFFSYFWLIFVQMASTGLKSLRFSGWGSHGNFAHTYTGTHVIYIHSSTDTNTHTQRRTHHQRQRASFMVPWKAEMRPSFHRGICLIQTLMVRLLLSPALSLPPLGKRDGLFFFLIKNIDLKNKHFCISKQAVLPKLHILYWSAFYCQFSFSWTGKKYNLIMCLVTVGNQSH